MRGTVINPEAGVQKSISTEVPKVPHCWFLTDRINSSEKGAVKSYYSSKVDARLDINSLKPGLYLLSIYHGHEVKKERIVVSSEF
jgi:hypothetical protein